MPKEDSWKTDPIAAAALNANAFSEMNEGRYDEEKIRAELMEKVKNMGQRTTPINGIIFSDEDISTIFEAVGLSLKYAWSAPQTDLAYTSKAQKLLDRILPEAQRIAATGPAK